MYISVLFLAVVIISVAYQKWFILFSEMQQFFLSLQHPVMFVLAKPLWKEPRQPTHIHTYTLTHTHTKILAHKHTNYCMHTCCVAQCIRRNSNICNLIVLF